MEQPRTFPNPFKTKQGLNIIESEHVQHRFKDDPTKFLHMTFQPNTWLADIVQMGNNKGTPLYWYLFIHGNSRYVVIYPASKDLYNEETDQWETLNIERKNANNWIRTLINFVANYKLDILITDFEKSWRGKEADHFYLKNEITHEAVNVAEKGHSRMGILDRFVRTLRDMLENLPDDWKANNETTNIQILVKIYNKTQHRTLTKYLGKPTTPEQVLKDPELEAHLTRAIAADNWSTSHRPWYKIPVGNYVVVKSTRNKALSKIRATALPDLWQVMENEGQKYTLKNPKTNEIISVFRSQIKRAPLSDPSNVAFKFNIWGDVI